MNLGEVRVWRRGKSRLVCVAEASRVVNVSELASESALPRAPSSLPSLGPALLWVTTGSLVGQPCAKSRGSVTSSTRSSINPSPRVCDIISNNLHRHESQQPAPNTLYFVHPPTRRTPFKPQFISIPTCPSGPTTGHSNKMVLQEGFKYP